MKLVDLADGPAADVRPGVVEAHRDGAPTWLKPLESGADGPCCNPIIRYRQRNGHGMSLAKIEHVEFDHRFEAVD